MQRRAGVSKSGGLVLQCDICFSARPDGVDGPNGIYGLAALCIGGGQGIAMAIEALNSKNYRIWRKAELRGDDRPPLSNQ